MGTPVGTEMDENKVAELSDGTVMLNSREHVRTGHRWVALSHDGGETYQDLHRDPSLVDPATMLSSPAPTPRRPRAPRRPRCCCSPTRTTSRTRA